MSRRMALPPEHRAEIGRAIASECCRYFRRKYDQVNAEDLIKCRAVKTFAMGAMGAATKCS